MAGWFELHKSKNGKQFHFSLKAGNAEAILRSEMYNSKSAAENGIKSVQTNSPIDKRYEQKEAANGKFHFNLKAGNHQIIGSSQMYVSVDSCKKGIASVKTNGSTGTIKDKTEA